jgi:hypothetical protein
MRHAGTLVEIDNGGLSVGAELALSGAGGITGLQRMSATQMLAALAAAAAMDGEFANDGLSRDVGLKLLIQMILDDVAAAIRTLFGQGRIEGFIDALSRRRLTMSVLAVLLALLAARPLGPFLGFAFGKRRGLTFRSAFEFFDPLLQLGNQVAQLLIFAEQLLIGRRVHAGASTATTVSAAQDYRHSAEVRQDGAKQSPFGNAASAVHRS